MSPEARIESRRQVREDFTAGSPWRLVPDPSGDGDPNYFAIHGGVGFFDEDNPQGFHLTGFIQKADALKIAAAKEMYESLRRMLTLVEANYASTPGLYEHAKAALAKAEGN
jgi:hypothetical protein